ncbi:NitT/TauT family transport system permease protein [Bifidobacterium bohemicum]|uniref:ABC transporter permease n=1 Tax=Bifidobacterium bohemicum TaxID=638617 RepID=UPI000529BBD0|nr:ABC transporter permease subunit [Bifidobacterium bohemicum]SCB93045.1 NitT/TauT family transport system permease protein [Bifidobacterium bohemicum]
MNEFTISRSSPAGTNAGNSDDVSTARRVISDCLVVAGILAVFGLVGWLLPSVGAPIGPDGMPSTVSTDLRNLPYYALRSVFRMAIALIFSLVFTFVYGLAAARSKRLGKVLIPLLDILQSVPILGFLSATVAIWLALFPGSELGVEAASIFAIFTSQAWNMTFSFHRSLLSEPQELDEAVRNLRLTRWQRFWTLDVPNSMIPLIWNMMMSVGGGWFFLTASEVISVGNRDYALPGIGSFVATASAEEKPGKVACAIVTMVLIVVVIDVLVWKPLTAWAEKFRITNNASETPKKSAVLTVIRQSHIDKWIATLLTPIKDGLDRVMRVFGRTGARWTAPAKRRRTGDLVFDVAVGAIVVFGAYQLLSSIAQKTGFDELGHAFGLGFITFLRVLLLTIVCSVIWVPIGAIVGMNPRISRFAEPLVQVLSSFPANFIFPFITMWFVAWNIDINWGSILLMALGTQWYILFNVIAGASAIPNDLLEMTHNMGLSTWMRWKKLILPSVFGSWVTGGITAAGGAWNASIVSEVVSYGRHTLTADGIGAYITQATAENNGMKVLIGVVVMAVFVVGANRLFWTPLENLADTRFALN